MTQKLIEQKRLIEEARTALRKIEIFEELIQEDKAIKRGFSIQDFQTELNKWQNRYAATLTDLTKSLCHHLGYEIKLKLKSSVELAENYSK
jgi:hypothetical protein